MGMMCVLILSVHWVLSALWGVCKVIFVECDSLREELCLWISEAQLGDCCLQGTWNVIFLVIHFWPCCVFSPFWLYFLITRECISKQTPHPASRGISVLPFSCAVHSDKYKTRDVESSFSHTLLWSAWKKKSLFLHRHLATLNSNLLFF